jgi:hypothetical protein
MYSKDQTVQHLTEHLTTLEAKRGRLVQEIDKEIEHVRATIASLRNASSTDQPQERNVFGDEFPIARIKGMTQVQALTAIARSNGGLIRAQEAKRLLIRAGLMRQTKNSTSTIHSVIIRSEKFERVNPGEYRLKNTPQNTNAEEDTTARLPVQ